MFIQNKYRVLIDWQIEFDTRRSIFLFKQKYKEQILKQVLIKERSLKNHNEFSSSIGNINGRE